MVKILKFNKLTYQDILSISDKLKSYKEDSNVFAYYVITLILLNTVFAICIFAVSALKTSTTKFWAFLALADAAWWIYCMVG